MITAGSMRMFKDYILTLKELPPEAPDGYPLDMTMTALPGGWMVRREGYWVVRLNEAQADKAINMCNEVSR